jgi:acetyl-CoA acetyltransferase
MRRVSIIVEGYTPFVRLNGRAIKGLAVEACYEALVNAGVASNLIEAF